MHLSLLVMLLMILAFGVAQNCFLNGANNLLLNSGTIRIRFLRINSGKISPGKFNETNYQKIKQNLRVVILQFKSIDPGS